MKSTLTLISTSFFCFLLAGCSLFSKDVEDINSVGHYSTDNPRGLIGANYDAADALLKASKNMLPPSKPILVASFVDIDDVQVSSTFGRMVAEQMGSRLAQQEYQVIELKMRTNSIFVQEQTGELLLSRQLRDISLQHDAFAVVVGTYAKSKRRVYVTAKLIRTDDNVILASYDYELPVGPDTRAMLQNKRFSGTR